MQRCKLSLRTTIDVQFDIQEGEEDTAEELIGLLEDGAAPAWMYRLFTNRLEAILEDGVELDEFVITGREPEPDEELDFG